MILLTYNNIYNIYYYLLKYSDKGKLSEKAGRKAAGPEDCMNQKCPGDSRVAETCDREPILFRGGFLFFWR